MSNASGPHCTRCGTPLRRRNDPVFRGTVLAVGSHHCGHAAKLLTSAATAAKMIASDDKFVHARYISPVITERAWITTLQQWTTTHDLEHRIVPVGANHTFVVSYRAGKTIDMCTILAMMSAQIDALGDRPRPERMIGAFESGKLRLINTTVEHTVTC